ncbi:winged helix-turn-helix domain-containing protein [Streptomyces sp. NPDC005925]|uniref:winged helix-turn-helix domain-containing protein n=1 Tax=Streptomyces sp. NPDC005925 TaxID=3157172 RepID=UPI0033F75946
MANTSRSQSPAPTPSAVPSAGLSGAPFPDRSPGGARHRRRAVDRDETTAATVPPVVDVAGLLPPGATWLPAPPHTLPPLPGRPPMIGYLVLVPAGRQPPFLPAPARPEAGRPPLRTAPGGVPGATGPAGDGDRDDAPPVPDDEAPLVRVDAVRRTVEVDGRELDLTYLEFELLAHLVARPGRVHSRAQLVSAVWGYGHVGDGRTVDVHVARLRRKLGAEHRSVIRTVRRVGYTYVPPTRR